MSGKIGAAARGSLLPARSLQGAAVRMAELALALVIALPWFSAHAQQDAGQPAAEAPQQETKQPAQPVTPAETQPPLEQPAQTPTASEPSSIETQPGAQQPGEGAQLQTGTSSGLSMDSRLENLLADHQYARIEEQLSEMPQDMARLYRGILANRSNDVEQSVKLLEPLVDDVTASGNTDREKLLRMALAEDYLRIGDWSKASRAYQALDKRFHDKLSVDEQDEIEMPLKMLPLAKNDPPMTAEPCEPFRQQVSHDPLGLIDIPVFIDARSRNWMLDPTAPFNLISHSTATDVGLTISGEAATIRTLTGRPIKVRPTVIPRMTIGGRLTLRNVTAFVFEDSDFAFQQSGYQVEGVLGYPALAAMGRLTVLDNAIEVDPADGIDSKPEDLLNDGAHFYLDGDRVIVALGRIPEAGADSSSSSPSSGGSEAGKQAGVDDRMFAVDAGSQQTYLTSRWFDEHAADFNNQKMSVLPIDGLDSAPLPAYTAETVQLGVGGAEIDLHFIPVLTQPVGSAARDDVYGVIGIDALDQMGSYSFDYRTMRFTASGE